MQKIIWGAVALFLVAVLSVAAISWRRPLAVAAWMNRRTLTRAGFTKSLVPTPVGQQTIFAGGSGPTLILLHGAGDQAGAWAKVAPSFTSRYHVVIPDLAGHAESDPKAGPLSIGTIFGGVEAIANREPGKVIIVGNSLGAWIATLYAHNHPEKIERLVLVNGGPLVGNRPDLTLTPGNREEARKLLDALMDPGSAKIPDFVVDDIVRQAQNGPLMRMSETASEMPKYLLEGRMNEVTVPVTLLWGESDKLMSLDYAKRLQAQLPVSQLITLSRCGHAPQLECPKAFTARLTELLQTPVVPLNNEAISGEKAK